MPSKRKRTFIHLREAPASAIICCFHSISKHQIHYREVCMPLPEVNYYKQINLCQLFSSTAYIQTRGDKHWWPVGHT